MKVHCFTDIFVTKMEEGKRRRQKGEEEKGDVMVVVEVSSWILKSCWLMWLVS